MLIAGTICAWHVLSLACCMQLSWKLAAQEKTQFRVIRRLPFHIPCGDLLVEFYKLLYRLKVRELIQFFRVL